MSRMYEILIMGYECQRCGNTWVRRKTNPKRCPACGSSHWKTKKPKPKYTSKVKKVSKPTTKKKTIKKKSTKK